jgi:hypothetical protein
MSSVSGCVLGAALLMAIGWCGGAQAAPVELEFSGIVSDTTIPGVSVGNTITFDVFADNGGAGLDSQSWNQGNITSATIQAGSYSATASGALLGGSGGFSTDASGNLVTLDFFMIQEGSDTNGNPQFTYFMNASNDIWFACSDVLCTTNTSFGASSPPSIDNTTISLVSSTPLPAALPLLATGLGGLGLLGWRRKRKAQAVA